MVEGKADVGAGGPEHVRVAVGKDGELVAGAPEPLERRHHVGEGLQFFDLADEPTHLVLGVGDFAAVHHMGYRAVADLAVGRVSAVEQRIDHRVLEVRAPPPRHEAAGRACPTLLGKERRDRLRQSLLHVDDGAVLVEGQRLDLALEDFGPFHRNLLRLWRLGEPRRSRAGGSSPPLPAFDHIATGGHCEPRGGQVAAKQSRGCSRRALRVSPDIASAPND